MECPKSSIKYYVALAAVILGCQQQQRQPEGADPSSSAASSATKLVAGLGAAHHTVSTANSEAQKYFDQGLAYVYGFNHAEAVRSFNRAAELDPKLAMAHWGRALALGPNINAPEIDEAAAKGAYEAVQLALALSGSATPAERGYVAALAK